MMPPHDIRLQKRDPERNQYRYYLLTMQPNLFGTWSLIREWGKIGRPGRVKIDLCDSYEELMLTDFRGGTSGIVLTAAAGEAILGPWVGRVCNRPFTIGSGRMASWFG
jgi:hypothetical protein